MLRRSVVGVVSWDERDEEEAESRRRYRGGVMNVEVLVVEVVVEGGRPRRER